MTRQNNTTLPFEYTSRYNVLKVTPRAIKKTIRFFEKMSFYFRIITQAPNEYVSWFSERTKPGSGVSEETATVAREEVA